jgi:tetratricopeptide (TPR) repeat protein
MPRAVMGGAGRASPDRQCSASVFAVAALVTVGAAAPRAAAADASFWERAAEGARARPDRLAVEAETLLRAEPRSPERLARAEALAREALAAAPDNFRALMVLAEASARAAHPAATVAALERACPVAPAGVDAASCWFHLGVERSRQGRFAEALVAYESLVAVGDADAAALTNMAELLMAEGRLVESEARYREAIRLEAQATPFGRIETSHALAVATYGLAVALDRESEPEAAREMMSRALKLDARHALLTAAEQPDTDLFFVPDGDVYYYLGLAGEVAGDVDDGAAAFQEFLRRRPRDASATRARAHLDGLLALARAGAPARGVGRGSSPAPRVVAAGTVLADGPVPAPLVDAAWRGRADLLDACLAEAAAADALPSREGLRLAFELTIDARGVVTEAVAKAPAALDATFARCAEAALRDGLRVPPPRRARPTHARLELLVGVAP